MSILLMPFQPRFMCLTLALSLFVASLVGLNFDCLAFTIEMPFKDNANLPDEATGWSGERSRKLGASVLLPVLAVLDQLRDTP